MIRRSVLILALGSIAMLSACGGDDGLTVKGSALVVGTEPEFQTGFNFIEDTRIDVDDTSAEGRITGTCELLQTASEDGPSWALIATILGGQVEEGLGLSSITVMQNTAAPIEEGRIEADLGGTSFKSTEGACSVEILYTVGDDDGLVGVTGGCEITDRDGNAVMATIDLDFVGCSVAD
jgi:hypothetical protein